jgi:threonine synthase
LFDYRDPFPFDLDRIDPSQRGLWRYRHSFGMPESVEPVTLGEGGTPLVWANVAGRKVGFKCEYLNPTGSFKDRGSTTIATWLRSQGVDEAVEDSSGNAGASFAAYAARAGMRTRIFVPEIASGPKRAQIEAYGAELVPIAGSRQDVTEAARQAVKKGAAYASHAYLPFNLPGYATAAYEIFEQVGSMPGAVIVPAGQGGFLLGMARGFAALRIATESAQIPTIIGVQARACAPLWANFTAGRQGMALVSDHPTLAEGVRVRYPLRGDAVVRAIRESNGAVVAVEETDILPARDALAHLGLYVEPTSAIVWAALNQVVPQLTDPIVVVLTGFGLKYGVK